MSKVKNGDFVQLHYTGTLEDGSVFDSSDGRPPLEFQVGAGGIIQGFNDAVIDMALNEEKQVVLAPDQAYGQPKEDLKRDFPHFFSLTSWMLRLKKNEWQGSIPPHFRQPFPRGPAATP